MFGEDPDAPWEGWEPVVYVAYTASFLLLFFGLGYKPQTNIHQWAREEAIARIEAEERGEKVVFGKHYSTFKEVRYEKGEAGEIPQLFEGEVDEDEDE